MNISAIDLINELEPKLSKILNFVDSIEVEIRKRNDNRFHLEITCFFKFNDQSEDGNFTTRFHNILKNGCISITQPEIIEKVIDEAKKIEKKFYKALNDPPQNTTFSL